VSFLGSTLRPPVLALGVAGMAVALARRGWRPLAIPLALVAAGTLTFVVTGLAGLSVLPPLPDASGRRLRAVRRVRADRWHELDRADPWRTAGAGPRSRRSARRVAAAVLLPGAARKLNREVTFVRSTHDELQSLLHRPVVASGRRCGPIVFPNLPPRPRRPLAPRREARGGDGAPATEARTGVRIYVSGRTGRSSASAGGRVPERTNEPDERFHEVARAGPLEAFVRCP